MNKLSPGVYYWRLPGVNSALLAFALLAILGASRASAEDCQMFPSVDWWNITHENIIKYVETNHDGDWDAYISKWEKHTKKIEGVSAKGNAIVTPTGVKVSGDALKTYIGQLYQRVNVTRCLADNYKKQHKGDLPAKAKAKAAKPDQETMAESVGNGGGAKTTTIKDEDFKLDILASCQNGEFVFEAVNTGDDWPGSANFRIISKNGDKTFASRGLKLARNGKVKFSIKPEEVKGEAGIRIEPSWTSHYIEYGAKIDCLP